MFNKLVGIISMSEKKVKGNIIDLVNYFLCIYYVGWFDKDLDGLILFINDGDIINEILCVENKYEKEYIVVVDKLIISEFIKYMFEGVKILGIKMFFCEVI